MAYEMIEEMGLNIRDVPMVFIVGFERSGTTLMQELMNSHPNIVAPPEYPFMIYLHHQFGHIKHWESADITDFVDLLYTRPLFSLWGIRKEKLTEELMLVREYADYGLVCKTIFNQMRQDKKEIRLFCDKNPENSLHIKTLLKIYPEAKFIHIIRDPRDAVNSQIRSFRKKNIYLTARRWVGYNSAIEKMKKRMPLRFHTIFYEKLVTDTETELKSVCNFLNIPFNASMLQHHFPERLNALRENSLFKRVENMHQGLLSPVNSSNIGRWKKEMNGKDIAITEKTTAYLAVEKYGYLFTAQNTGLVSGPKILYSRLYYYIWILYTRLRYKNSRLNKMHYTRKINRDPKRII